MDDLISRKAAIKTLALNTDYLTPAGIKNDLINHPGKECDWLGGIDEAISIIEELPSAPAVPLDRLCEWLANSFSDPPCCTLENVRCKMECRGFTQMNYSECWRYVLTKWMEGLDAAD